MEFRKMVMITLYANQKKTHRCTEQTFRLNEIFFYGREWRDLVVSFLCITSTLLGLRLCDLNLAGEWVSHGDLGTWEWERHLSSVTGFSIKLPEVLSTTSLPHSVFQIPPLPCSQRIFQIPVCHAWFFHFCFSWSNVGH